MAKRSVHYVRGPPEWIRIDSLSWIKTEKVNQNWFTLLNQNRKSESNLIHSHTALKRTLCGADVQHRIRREAARKAAIWRVCGAVGRREPYNLTLESKTYYTQNYDTMR